MFNRILCLGAHTDDCEVGCGGLLSRFIQEGKEVYYVTFSFAEKSLPKGFNKDTIYKEVRRASSVIGIKKSNLILFDYEVRDFYKYRQDILNDLVKLNKQIKPDLVLTHNTQDTHQDHEIISQESFRAFKQFTIFGYESFINNRRFNSDIYIALNDIHLKTKLDAINCYKSQIIKKSFSTNIIEKVASIRGFQIGLEYAECFENIRFIMR